MIAEDERVRAVIDAAKINLFAGQVEDDAAVDRAVELGMVEKYYEGAAGFLGLAKLRLKP